MPARLSALSLLILLAVPARAQDATCGPDARAVRAQLSADYGGRDLLLDAGRAAELDRLVAEAETAADLAACDSLLWTATALFPDGHLDVATPRRQPARFWPARRFGPWGGELGLRFVGDSAAVLRIPSFGLAHKAAIDSLIAANRERLLQTPYLVVNVQNNGGGSDASFASLLPFILSGPVQMVPAEIVASPANIADFEACAEDERLDDETRAWLRDRIAEMRAVEPGAFVLFGEEDAEAFEPTAMPRAVAVVAEGSTASSAEELVLMARTSPKVTIVGTPTSGALDYSNVRDVELPSGERVLHLPTSRRAWLPAASVDGGGIRPDVTVPAGVADWDAFALGVLVARDATPLEPAVRDFAQRVPVAVAERE